MWNLKKWYRWTYLQGRNKDTDIENKHMNTKVGKRGRMIWKIGVYIYTLRGSCWAAIYGVAQSRTQLKQLSSSSIRYGFSFPNMQRVQESVEVLGEEIILQWVEKGLDFQLTTWWKVNPCKLLPSPFRQWGR